MEKCWIRANKCEIQQKEGIDLVAKNKETLN